MLAKRLAQDGFLVFAGCLDSNSEGAMVIKKSRNIRVLQLDITKDNQVDEALASVKRDLGSKVLWSVIANAGIANSGLLEWMTMESILQVFDVNVFGTVRVAKKFLPLLKKSKGRIVIVTSGYGSYTVPLGIAYCMSKYALVSLVDGLRRELHAKRVDVVAIEPALYNHQWVPSASCRPCPASPCEGTLQRYKPQNGLPTGTVGSENLFNVVFILAKWAGTLLTELRIALKESFHWESLQAGIGNGLSGKVTLTTSANAESVKKPAHMNRTSTLECNSAPPFIAECDNSTYWVYLPTRRADLPSAGR
ncbi:hypothetical protein HPB48_006139 [Haemaphysalis longicornis]|uniref:Uncharacterized protein n=1 Tax=Haemaphysalis longicornis TaxID=44386 RepID=A0A9J6GX31_HAELO|nr:hypothetical protein HPB48_006139 [Haemaphysalis longicornis]